MKTPWKATIVLGIALFLVCTHSAKQITGTVSETDTAMIYNPDNTPAKGAMVRFFAATDSTRTVEYQTKTDTNGHYVVSGLAKGSYNMVATKDSLIVFQDSIFANSDTVFVKTDTLEKQGSITGIVGLQPNHDPRTVTVQVLGTDLYSNVDKYGRFTLSPVAKGNYNLRLVTTMPDYTPTYATIHTEGQKKDSLLDTLWLTFTGIPVVTGLTAVYDTLNGLVHLSWNKPDYRDFQDFLIFRDVYNSVTLSSVPLYSCEDTVFTDTIFKRSNGIGQLSFIDTSDYRFKYRVCVENNSTKHGDTYKFADVVAASPIKVRTFFSWKFLNTMTDSASINDTVSIIVNFQNATRKNMKLSWYIGKKDYLFKTVVDSSISGSDTIKYVWKIASRPKIYVSMIDKANSIWLDSTALNIVQDIPVANAGIDTAVDFNTEIKLHGTGSDRFGFIKKLEWDFGNSGTFKKTLIGDASIIAPSSAQVYQCILKVTDDDDNIGFDTVNITVFGIMTDVDENTYRTVKLGNQEWMAENLRTTKYNNNTPIPLVTYDRYNSSGLSTPGYCYINNITDKNVIKEFGALYNWYAIDPENPNQIAPAGWHVPSDSEWNILQNYLITNGYNWDGTTAGNKIAKAMATQTEWQISNAIGGIGNDLAKNNKSYFSAFPACSGFSNVDAEYWWSTSTERGIFADCAGLTTYSKNWLGQISVRLVKNN